MKEIAARAPARPAHADVALANRVLGLQSLVVCHDEQLSRSLFQVLDELGIASQRHHDPGEVRGALTREKFDLVVVDCDQLEDGTQFLQVIRGTPFHKTVTILAIAEQPTTLQEAFQMGATLVLGKPSSAKLLSMAFRASIGKMIGERRRSFRYLVDVPVSIRIDGGQALRATAINLSEYGMAIQADFPVPAKECVRVSFVLPGTEFSMETEGVVAMWSEQHRQAGIRFLDLDKLARRQFNGWRDNQFEQLLHALQKEDTARAARELLAGTRLRPLD